jgi:hypothetical protein
VIIYSFLECGFLLRSASVGGSVANANEAKVSIIKLTLINIKLPITFEWESKLRLLLPKLQLKLGKLPPNLQSVRIARTF